MTFTVEGREYAVADMISIPIRPNGYPTVYVARDYSAFAVLGFDSHGVTLISLSPDEFRGLGKVYNIPALHEAIAELDRRGATPPPHMHVHKTTCDCRLG